MDTPKTGFWHIAARSLAPPDFLIGLLYDQQEIRKNNGQRHWN
jgi:hypothetical protein